MKEAKQDKKQRTVPKNESIYTFLDNWFDKGSAWNEQLS